MTAELDGALTALAGVDVDSLTDGEVHRSLVDVTAQLSRLQAMQLQLADAWTRRSTWSEDGSRSPGARLARETHTKRSVANNVIRRATALSSMPETRSALEDGTITVEHLDVLIAADHGHRRPHFAADEAQLVSFCRELQFWEADKVIQYWRHRVDALCGKDDGPPPSWSNRQAGSHRGIDGELHVDAIFDRVGGAAFLHAWDRIDDELRCADRRALADGGKVPRTVAQRRLDALTEMAVRATSNPDNSSRPRPLVTVAVGAESFRRLCELSDGTVVAPGELVPHLSEADVHTIIFNGPFHALAASPARSFTGLLRRAIEVRDRVCQHPASDGDPIDRCDVDHVVPRALGGITCQCNGQLLERGRNRDPRRRALTAADITVWQDDPTVVSARRRLDDLCRRRRHQPP